MDNDILGTTYERKIINSLLTDSISPITPGDYIKKVCTNNRSLK